MAKEIQQLTAMAVTRASKQGLYPDGAGLYLRVGRGGAKSWAFRFMLNGKAREMGLGGLAKVGLADARKKATDARLLLSDGRDPITHRQEEETRRAADEKLAAARSMTFDKCAEAYISAHEASWRNKKHRQQWRSTLTTYVSPVFGSVPVQDVDIDLIMKVIEPLWSEKTETARRVRGRVEVILDWAKVRGYSRPTPKPMVVVVGRFEGRGDGFANISAKPTDRGGRPLRQRVRLRSRRRRLHQRSGKVCLRRKSRHRDLTASRRLLTLAV